MPLVGVIMGSRSDWETMRHAADRLRELGVPHEVRVVSAHRTPQLLVEYATTAEARGLEVLIAGAGGAAHLPGMAAAMTVLPVLGVPVESKALHGLDSLLSIVQMPGGVPVGTLAVGKAGAVNAALLAAAIVGNKHPEFREALRRFRDEQTRAVLNDPDPRQEGAMTVGVLGGGQLGRMLALAGYPLGLRFRFLDSSPHAPAGHLAELHAGDYEGLDVLGPFAAGLDVVTYEFENVPVASVRWLAGRLPVFPPPQALEAAQDRLTEKTFFRGLGIPTPPFLAVDSEEGFRAALRRIGLPAVLKTRRLGYDGKGQLVLREPKDADHAWRVLGDVPQILEGFVPFDRELSLLAVRGRGGATAFYPLVENHHRDGMLRLSLAPAPGLSADLQRQAEGHAQRALEALDYVGVLAIEFFEAGGRLLANEMAPRVHNSGHWTIEGSATSQFENHLRAVLGWPLGSTETVGPSAMVNLIGSVPPPEAVLRLPRAHLHLYGKAPAAGRKLGHVTIVERDEAALRARLEELRAHHQPEAPAREGR